jgi:hypothetical protein
METNIFIFVLLGRSENVPAPIETREINSPLRTNFQSQSEAGWRAVLIQEELEAGILPFKPL